MSFKSLLTHDVTVQQKSRTAGGAGDWTESWSSLGTMSCRLRPLSASKSLEFLRSGRSTTHLVYAETQQGFTENLSRLLKAGEQLRMVYTEDGVTRYFDVDGAVDYDQQRRYTEIACTESDASSVNNA